MTMQHRPFSPANECNGGEAKNAAPDARPGSGGGGGGAAQHKREYDVPGGRPERHPASPRGRVAAAGRGRWGILSPVHVGEV